MKTPNLITESVKAKKALTSVQLTNWITEFNEFSTSKIVPDAAANETAMAAVEKREKLTYEVLANLSEGYKNNTLLKLTKADLKDSYQKALSAKTATTIATVLAAQQVSDIKLAEQTFKNAFDIYLKVNNGIEDFPVSSALQIFKAKFDFETGKKPDLVVSDLNKAFSSKSTDKPLGLALSYFALAAGNNSLAKKTMDRFSPDFGNFNEMVIRRSLDPNNDFGGNGNPGFPDFPPSGFGNGGGGRPDFPDFGNGGIPDLPDDFRDPFPTDGKPFDKNPIDGLIDRNREVNIPKPLTDTTSSKFPENFYTYQYHLLNPDKLNEFSTYISDHEEVKNNASNVIQVIYKAHKNWSSALTELKSQRYANAIVKLNTAQDHALAILRIVTDGAVSFSRNKPRPIPGVLTIPADTVITFDMQSILKEYTANNRPSKDPFIQSKNDRKGILDLDSLHFRDWIKPIQNYQPGTAPLKKDSLSGNNPKKYLTNSWTTENSISDHNGLTDAERAAFKKRVEFFDFQLFCLAYIFIPFAKIEAYRFSKQYENALTEIKRIKSLDNEFAFLNKNIEKPFLKILEAQILLEKAEKEYKSGTISNNLIDPNTGNPKGLVAKITYDQAVAAFDEYPLYQKNVFDAVGNFPSPQKTNNRLSDLKTNRIHSKEIYLPKTESPIANRLGISLKKDFPWKKNVLFTLTNETGYCTNPLIYALIMQAKSRLIQIDKSFNYLGYDDNFLPSWKFNFLLDRARYYTDQTKNLQRDYLNFISNAEREEFQEMSSGQALSMERMNVTVENARVDFSVKEQETVQESNELASLQAENAEERQKNFDEYDKEADDADILIGISGAIGGTVQIITGGLALSAGDPSGLLSVAGGVSTIAGTAGAIKKEGAQRDMEQKNLELSIKEAKQAEEVSEKQLEVANQSVVIANLQAQAALMRLEFAKDNYEYLRNRLTNAELWFRLAHHVREIANTYFRRAIETSFLAEQAYEFMVDQKVDVIRFDYDNDELGDMLGADYLKADLDYLEHHLIVNHKEKLQQVKCVISLARDFPQALQELRENEQSIIPVSLQYLEKRFPGLYQMKVSAIDVQPLAIVNPTRFNVELTHLGSGLLRTQSNVVHTDGSGENVANNFNQYGTRGATPWVQNVETLFPVKTLFTPVETSIFSGLTIAEEGAYFQSFSTQQKSAFEDCPAAAGWLIDMGMAENEMVPDSLADVLLTFYITGYHSRELKAEMDLVRSQETQLVTNSFSAQRIFPDAFFNFQRSGSTRFPITPDMLTINKRISNLNELSFRLIPAKTETAASRFSSTHFSTQSLKNNKLETNYTSPQMYLEGSDMFLTITLLNIKNRNIEIFAAENPALVLKRNALTNDTHVFDKLEFKKQGKQVVIIRETTGGKLQDYPIEVFVSKTEKMILPVTSFTQAKLTSGVITLESFVLAKSGSSVKPVAEKTQNIQCFVLDNQGNIVASTTTLSGFKLDLSEFKTLTEFTILSVYSQKVTASFTCNQDIKPFKEILQKNALRTNVKTHNNSNNKLTRFSEHLFGTGLKTVKSPIDDWQLSIAPAENPFMECYDCNGSKVIDAGMFSDIILTMEYRLLSR